MNGRFPLASLHELLALLREQLLLLLAILLLVIAMLLPPIAITRSSWDHIVIFDVTQSMNVDDMLIDGQPATRLEFAKHAVRLALNDPDCNTRIGWGIFSGRKTILLLTPVNPCENYNAMIDALAGIDGRMAWDNSSEITEGVFWVMRTLRTLEHPPNVFFMTDGHEAPPRPQDLRRKNEHPGEVNGWLLGLGDTIPRPIPKTDADGKPLGFWHASEVMQADTSTGAVISHEQLSELREQHLIELAGDSGFRYQRLADPDVLRKAMHDPALARPASVPTDLRWVPALLALLLLAWRFRPLRA
jgi:mxaL protein